MNSRTTTTPRTRIEVEREAEAALRRHGLYSVPVDPVTLANREGIKVSNATFSDDGISGMVARRGTDISILVNQSDHPVRKRFTIAHELGHHFLHLAQDGDFVDRATDLFRTYEAEPTETITDERRREIQANTFAAALLMPAAFVREAYAKTDDLDALARMFQVSEWAMAIRLSGLGLT